MILVPSNTAALPTSKAVTYVGATTSLSSSISIPAHQVGDIIIITGFNRQIDVPNAVSLPAAGGTVPTWTYLNGISGFAPYGGNGYNVGGTMAWTKATATNTTSGTWTNANGMGCMVFRGSGAVTTIGYSLLAQAGPQTYTSIGAGGPFATRDVNMGAGSNSKVAHMLSTYTNVTIGSMSGWTLAASTSYMRLNYQPNVGTGWSMPAQTMSSASAYISMAAEVISYT